MNQGQQFPSSFITSPLSMQTAQLSHNSYRLLVTPGGSWIEKITTCTIARFLISPSSPLLSLASTGFDYQPSYGVDKRCNVTPLNRVDEEVSRTLSCWSDSQSHWHTCNIVLRVAGGGGGLVSPSAAFKHLDQNDNKIDLKCSSKLMSICLLDQNARQQINKNRGNSLQRLCLLILSLDLNN